MKGDTAGSTSKPETTTDWDRLRDQADEEIHPALANDPDTQPTNETFWKDARVVMPTRKETVTMRLNADLLE